MQELTFPYRAQKASAISTLFALLFIMAGENVLVVILITIFIHMPVLKFAPVSLLLVFELFIALNLLSPLWTKHRLNATSLRLHFGIAFQANIPRSAIVSVKPVRERMVLAVARYEGDKQRIMAALSDQGQVLLRLDQPYPFRVGLSKVQADSILFNVDNRDALIAALGETTKETSIGETAPARESLPKIEAQRITFARTNISFSQDTPLALRTEQLTRHYHDIVAVNDLNLAVHRGEIYGFLGTNGAGKTTTMKMLVGLLQPTSGRAWINGFDVSDQSLQAKASLGYVADRSLLYDRLTGREFLSFLAQLRGIPREEAEKRVEELLNMLELRERANSPCSTYSFGMKRKLSLAGALLHRPAVLILDEPLNGLDPLSARRLKDLFAELAAQGTTIFLSTHDLATAEAICHRVGIIAHGRLLAEGSAFELRQLAQAPDLEAVFLSLTAEEITV